MKSDNVVTWEDVEKKLFAQPGFKEATEEVELEFQIARAIIEARIHRGITQADLARAMNTKQSVISRVENARTIPSLSFLKRLSQALGTSLQVRLVTR